MRFRVTFISFACCLLCGLSVRAQDLGPRITYMGLATSSDYPIAPEPTPENGRQVYSWPQGYGFSVVIEAAPGDDRRAVGVNAFAYDPNNPRVLPDLQVLVSYRLGNGDPTVCEAGDQIGIPEIPSLDFDGSAAVAAAINDFGCRVNDGEGVPVAHVQPSDACTRAATFDYTFVDPDTTTQYCAFIARSFTFADGDTVVAARVRDVTGVYGPRREIVVRVTGFDPTATPPPTHTATATRAASSTPTRTATRTATTPPPCPGDCSGNRIVTVDEVLAGVNIALERAALPSCPNCDNDHNGIVSIAELTRAVGALLHGCD